MTKRLAAAYLWYAVIWFGYEIAWTVTGVPRIVGPVLAASVAVFVTIDPFHWFWSRPESSPSRQRRTDLGQDVTAEPSAR